MAQRFSLQKYNSLNYQALWNRPWSQSCIKRDSISLT